MSPPPAAPRPPAHVAPYVRALGAEAAAEFLIAFGGAEMAFAAAPRGASLLVRAAGEAGAARLVAEFGPVKRRVPLARAWLAHVLAARGLPVAGIARRLRMSDVAVRRALKAPPDGSTPRRAERGRPGDPRQLPLFRSGGA